MSKLVIEEILRRIEEREQEENVFLNICFKDDISIRMKDKRTVDFSFAKLKLAIEESMDWVTITDDSGTQVCVNLNEIVFFQYHV